MGESCVNSVLQCVFRFTSDCNRWCLILVFIGWRGNQRLHQVVQINFLTYPSVIYISSIDLTMVWAGNAGKSIQQNVISDVFSIRKASRISYYLIFWNIKTICNLGYIQISRYGIGSLNLLGIRFHGSLSSQLHQSLQIQVLKFHARAKVCMIFLSSAGSSNAISLLCTVQMELHNRLEWNLFSGYFKTQVWCKQSSFICSLVKD